MTIEDFDEERLSLVVSLEGSINELDNLEDICGSSKKLLLLLQPCWGMPDYVIPSGTGQLSRFRPGNERCDCPMKSNRF